TNEIYFRLSCSYFGVIRCLSERYSLRLRSFGWFDKFFRQTPIFRGISNQLYLSLYLFRLLCTVSGCFLYTLSPVQKLFYIDFLGIRTVLAQLFFQTFNSCLALIF